MLHRAVLLLLVLLAGCSMFGAEKATGREPAKLGEFKPTAKAEVRWHQDVGSAGRVAMLPAVMDGAVYAADETGDLYRMRADSGKKVWHVDSGVKISAGVGAGEGLVLVGGEKGDVLAYDEEGKLRWHVLVSSEVTSAPQISQGIVVVRSGDGRITALRSSDGKQLWLFERALPALTIRTSAGVLIQDGVIYAGLPAGKLVAIDLASGLLNWEATVSVPSGNTELERVSDVTSVPVGSSGQVCAAAYQGNVACFDIKQGVLLWSREVSSSTGMTLKERYLYVTDDDDNVSALDKISGSALWKNDKFVHRHVSRALVLNGFVVVGDHAGYLHILNRDDGGIAARLKTGGAITSAPVEIDGGVLVQTSDGGLYSVAIK